MSQLWKELVERSDSALAQCLTLSRVKISKRTGSLQIELNGSRLLSRAEYKLVDKCFAAAFPGASAIVKVTYPALKAAVQGDIRLVTGLLSELVAHESPGSMPFLQWQNAGWQLKDGMLTVCVSSAEGAAYLKARGVDKLLEQLLWQMFAIRAVAQIRITGDEDNRVRQIAELRQRDAETVAAVAAKISAAPSAKGKRDPKQAIYGRMINDPEIQMSEITEDIGRATVMGEVAAFDMREAKNGQTKIVTFSMSDNTSSVNCKLFLSAKRGDEAQSVAKQAELLTAGVKDGKWIKARGSYRYDDYKREMVLMVTDIVAAEKPVREDAADEKRVELHAHTQMSAFDACASAEDLIRRAAQWGHRAIAITDHGVVQALPEAFGAAKRAGVKLLPGCEGYLIEDGARIVEGADMRPLNDCAFVVLDVETTGLNAQTDSIIEIGAVRIEGGREVAEFSRLINPERPLPDKIVEITGITPSMLRGQPVLSDVMDEFAGFCEGAVLVAHNAAFDMAFFKRAFAAAELPFDHPQLDTLSLVRNQYPNFRNHKLGTVCKMLGIPLTKAHRAVHDARATSLVLLRTLTDLRSGRAVRLLSELNGAYSTDAAGKSHHIILLAKNQDGMKNLYRLVSEGHLNYFYRTPRIPRGLIERYREGLIVGSACESGELFSALVAGKSDAELKRIASFYDYLEIQPIGNNDFLRREGVVQSEEELRDFNRRIVRLGEELGIPVVATGDVHFMDPDDAIYRTLLMAAKGFEDADTQPPLYFKTTDEMLDEFAYLGEETARRVVVEAPNAIADRVGEVNLFIKHPEGKETFQPVWDDAEQELTRLTMNRAHAIYGENLPDMVQKRIDKELGAIIGYGFSTLYMMAVKLVSKSMSDGYIVGSRGSVGSSLVAYLSGITEVNSLPAHYICPNCNRCEFDVPEQYSCGLDLPPKTCPDCSAQMDKDGFDVPFEAFLGFKGDKVPDIDLNFSGEYQPTAHEYVKDMFGKENVFRAGTIGTIAEKTGYGYVLKYLEERGRGASSAEKERLARGITGVKRTTGQHPAGMVVLPKGYEIYDFTPIQHPADDQSSDTITTHFDFNSMHDVLVKLDILGHDDPTMLRKLQDMTGVAPQEVPLHDAEVFASILSLFSTPKALGLTEDELGVATGTLGIPEFGTPFVRGMLVETRPTTMEELVRISGLSHGQEVWIDNAQELFRRGVALRECICTRDDIMNQLIKLGVEAEVAFKTMELVRKGKGLQDFMEEAINAVDAPDWFIESCKKIGYMFPKSHAVAYVTMALRIAYFKIYYPAQYYTCYLMRNEDSFDGVAMTTGSIPELRAMQAEIDELDKEERARKESQYAMLEILIEMILRGFSVLPVDMYKSRATEFVLADEIHILPPINSLPGIGQSAAEAYVQARAQGPFISQDDMVRRKVAKSTVEALRQAGCLNDIPATSQITLFDLGV